MTDTPTITLYEKCKHGFLVEHMLAQKGMAQMMWTCPGGRERTFQQEWECLYPEYADEACWSKHDILQTAQPRKHTRCGWNLWSEVTERPNTTDVIEEGTL